MEKAKVFFTKGITAESLGLGTTEYDLIEL
jgi:hypothetical protein